MGEKEKEKGGESWRISYDIYKNDLRKAYQGLVSDQEWLEQQQQYHSNLDIELSLKKACVQFWALEAGWKHKKKSKSVNIDWKSTLASAIDLT